MTKEMTMTDTSTLQNPKLRCWNLLSRIGSLPHHEKEFLMVVLAVAWAKNLSLPLAIEDAYPDGLRHPSDHLSVVPYSQRLAEALEDLEFLDRAERLRMMGNFAVAVAEIEEALIA